MILALDVGNTNIVMGCISDDTIYFVGRLSTDIERTEEEYAITFKNIIEMYGVDSKEIEGAIISSVVPPLITVLTDAVTKITGQAPLVVGPGVKTGLNILMDNPAQLGSDQVVDAIAALAQYKPPLIILDMGTATTISVVDKDANYIGGLIVPGVKLAAEALSGRTSQLPFISLEAPKRLIGKNTIDCMKSGMIYGAAAMIDGVVERIEETLGQPATVIATGGLGDIVTPFCKKDIIYDDNLLLKGLLLIYNKNKKSA